MDPRIREELEQFLLTAVNKPLAGLVDVCLIKATNLDLIDDLLRTNREATSLQDLREQARQDE